MDAGAERELLERELGGSWEPIASDLPPGGPRTIWRGADGVAWVGSPKRIAAEREGVARLGEHPARPVVVKETERAIVLAPFGPPIDDALAVVVGWPREGRRTIEGTRRELLRAIDTDVSTARALGKSAMRRRHVDRWLDARVAIETEIGVSFGGVHPGWLRKQGEKIVCLRCDGVRTDGWLALDLAGLSLDPSVSVDALRAAHRGNDEALDLALVMVWMRESVRSGDRSVAERAREIIEPGPEPESVRVWIEAPSFVDTRAWAKDGDEVPASRARWLLANVDGLAVGGGTIRVRTEPKIRAGRRAPVREDQDERRRRLFSRWDEGIETDDEGLISATPEALAGRLVSGLTGTVLDGTCGVGAIAIACAQQRGVKKVIAVDHDAWRLKMAEHNAGIYDVADRISLVHGDILEIAPRTAADVMVIDPPWGGRDYDRTRVALDDLEMDLRTLLAAFNGPVVLKLPRSFDVTTLPGEWSIEAMIDERGVLKFLVARRGL